MNKLKKTTIKISLIILSIVFFSSSVFANGLDEIVDENDSIYRYNALENKIYFPNTISNYNSSNSKEKLSVLGLEIHTATNDNAKKLKDITEHQNSSILESDNAISAIENRYGLKVFFVGNRLGVLKYQLVQMKNQSFVLNTLTLEAENSAIENQINNQVEISEQQQIKVENFILEQEDKFSLFGWFVSSL